MDMADQKHVGKKMADGSNIWHTNSKGGYWTGWMPKSLTPEELYYASITTVIDLLAIHPELADKFTIRK